MATIQYIDMVNPIAAVTLGCPSLTIVEAIRATIIDLCERGQVWRYTHPNITLTSPTYSYTFTPPDSQTLISQVETARVNDQPISVGTSKDGILNFPLFPDVTDLSPPTAMWQLDQRSFVVAPTPDTVTTYTLKLTTTLKPTQTSTGSDATVIQEHMETITHGTLHRLLLQQKRDWFNVDLAGYHGKQYSYKLNMFRAQANKGYGKVNINVAMRPFA